MCRSVNLPSGNSATIISYTVTESNGGYTFTKRETSYFNNMGNVSFYFAFCSGELYVMLYSSRTGTSAYLCINGKVFPCNDSTEDDRTLIPSLYPPRGN